MFIGPFGSRLYYDLTGPASGPAVVFGHSLASDSGMWAEQMDALLSEGYRVLRIDMRGHGGSDTVAGDYTMEQLAGDVIAVTDAVGIHNFHFVGLSIGGMFGQGLGVLHPTRLKSLMLCDTNSGTPPNAKDIWGPRVEAVTKAKSCVPITDETIKRWFSDTFRERNPGRWNQIRATIEATDPKGYIGCVAAITTFDWGPSLPTVSTPTLCVCGELDPSGGPSSMKPIADLIPGARYTAIPEARHFPNVERPAYFNRLLIDWLKSRE